jgi:hypothetical protein
MPKIKLIKSSRGVAPYALGVPGRHARGLPRGTLGYPEGSTGGPPPGLMGRYAALRLQAQESLTIPDTRYLKLLR